MRSKTATIALMALLLAGLLLAGCGGGNTPENPLTFDNICTDNAGLEIKFLDNMPPDQIYEGDTFYIGVQLQNEGCFPIQQGYVTLGGYEEDVTVIQSGNSQEILNNLEGHTIFNPAGGRADMFFEAQNTQIRFNLREMGETFSVSACYIYKTVAQAQVCINPNPPDYLDVRYDVCEAGTVSLDGVQGAPVIVDSVRTSSVNVGSGVLITFDIRVKNIGDGHVRDYNGGTCQGSPTVTLNSMTFSEYSTGSGGTGAITCSPTSLTLKRDNSKNLFRCTATITEPFAAYTTLAVIELGYAYTVTRDVNMLIKKP